MTINTLTPERHQSLKISIVTVSFNQAQFLREAIDSVLTQHYGELEYIVVDPGSTDDSREIIRSYGNQLAHTIFEPDTGAPDGLNKGFAHATGDICGFLNSDDFLLPDALDKIAACFILNPKADILMGNGFITDATGKYLRHVKATSFTPLRLVYGGTTSLQQATFFRRLTFIQSGGFNVHNTTCWDIELFLDMVRKGAKIAYLPSDLACFRIHPSSITGSGRVSDAYALDRQRLLNSVQLRHWPATDLLITLYFKSLRFLADPLELISTFRARLGKAL
jgi:glycosyltransferase involved in cell wall biosynthesis